MIPTVGPSKTTRITLFLFVVIGILLIGIASQASQAQAESRAQVFRMAVTPSRTQKPEKPTRTPGGGAIRTVIFSTPESHIFCGQLVFITGYYRIPGKPNVSTIALRSCNSQNLYIFRTHPRDLIPFFQFRDAKFGTGKEICTEEYGCLDQYITTFKNYIGLDSCSACGISMFPPTWTEVPLTPYTSTPIPPTRTPWPTPVTPTSTSTLSPGEITPTSNLFELLHGTETPTSIVATQNQPSPTETPTVQAAVSTPTPPQPFYRRIGPIGLLLLVLLAFLIPLVIVLRDYLQDR